MYYITKVTILVQYELRLTTHKDKLSVEVNLKIWLIRQFCAYRQSLIIGWGISYIF